MAADQPNRGYWTYVDGNGLSWNKLGAIDSACQAVDGSSASGANPDYPKASKRRHPRKAVYTDPTTFRTKSCVIYTSAAFDAIAAGDTIAVHVPGETATVTYTLSNKIPDRSPVNATARNLADHA